LLGGELELNVGECHDSVANPVPHNGDGRRSLRRKGIGTTLTKGDSARKNKTKTRNYGQENSSLATKKETRTGGKGVRDF